MPGGCHCVYCWVLLLLVPITFYKFPNLVLICFIFQIREADKLVRVSFLKFHNNKHIFIRIRRKAINVVLNNSSLA
jgi:hypothetical protein